MLIAMMATLFKHGFAQEPNLDQTDNSEKTLCTSVNKMMEINISYTCEGQVKPAPKFQIPQLNHRNIADQGPEYRNGIVLLGKIANEKQNF